MAVKGSEGTINLSILFVTTILTITEFEYLYMYKTRHSIMKIMDISDLYERNGGGRSRVSTLDEPPRRTVNQETLEYYAMAVDSEDPFTAYRSLYL